MSNAHTLDNDARELAARLLLAIEDLPLALANLHAALPGFPTSTPGAAATSAPSPSPEIDKSTGEILAPIRLTIVEQLASAPDPARTDRDRIEKIIRTLHAPITELYSLAEQWSYTTRRPKIDPDEQHEWCKSCLRLDRCEPRSERYAHYCRWCGDFRAAEGRLPSTDLLDKHHLGVRITQAMVKADHPVRRKRPAKKSRRRAAA